MLIAHCTLIKLKVHSLILSTSKVCWVFRCLIADNLAFSILDLFFAILTEISVGTIHNHVFSFVQEGPCSCLKRSGSFLVSLGRIIVLLSHLWVLLPMILIESSPPSWLKVRESLLYRRGFWNFALLFISRY